MSARKPRTRRAPPAPAPFVPANPRRTPLMLGTALGAILTMGYGRGAYAQQVCLGGPPDFLCAGPSIDQQDLFVVGNNLNATAAPDFSVVTLDPTGLRFTATNGNLTFTDDPSGSTISAVVRGMDMRAGGGALTITANGAVTGAITHGIFAYVYNMPGSGDLTVTTGETSSITGGYGGIFAIQQGLGALTTTVNGAVTGTTLLSYGIQTGIYNGGSTAALTVTTSAGSLVSGGYTGIVARTYGSGPVTVTVGGTVTGAYGRGIRARASNNMSTGSVSVATEAGSVVTGSTRGISAYSFGLGAVSVTVDGAVTGTALASRAVEAQVYNVLSTGSVSITTGAASVVAGGAVGLFARHVGLGTVSVTANGSVAATAGNGIGIYAVTTNSNAATMTVATGAGSTVSGTLWGIDAWQTGSGNLDVTVDGTVTGTVNDGLRARIINFVGTGALTITTGADSSLTGGARGIEALHTGLGSISVTVNGAVEGTGVDSLGIRAIAQSAANAAALTITTGAGSSVTGGARGIEAQHNGLGDLNVTAGGTVQGTGAGSVGILAEIDNNASLGTLSVATGAGSSVTGGYFGINAQHQGRGAIEITVDGAVEGFGMNGFGVAALIGNLGAVGDITITTGADSDVRGGYTGIYARNNGDGGVSVTADGVVEGTGYAGIRAFAAGDGSSGAVTVTTGAGSSVTGGSRGIDAIQSGWGALSVTADGQVVATNANSVGIRAEMNSAMNHADLAVTTGAGSSVIGGYQGIYALQEGTGAIDVTVGGTVSALGMNGFGILARLNNAGSAADLTIATGGASIVGGGGTGIYARNVGTGALAITVEGAVEGAVYAGIDALANGAAGTGTLSIETGAGSAVGGGQYGIVALQDGLGDLSVTANGTVEAFTLMGTAIDAEIYRPLSAGVLRVTTGAGSTVAASHYGINARQHGLGALQIVVNGAVDVGFGYGIAALLDNNASTAALTVTTGAGSEIRSTGLGISAQNLGGGNLLVDVGADAVVEGEQNGGISALHFGAGALSVVIGQGATVRSFDTAIQTYSLGGGPLSVTTGAGSVVGGGVGGISADMLGLGAVSVAVNGRVEAAGLAGIAAFISNPLSAAALDITLGAGAEVIVPVGPGINTAHAGAGNLMVTTGLNSRIEGSQPGIWAMHMGSGALGVAVDGFVTSSASDGIQARIGNDTSAGALSIATGAASVVMGADHGILARHEGLGTVAVNVGGTVASSGGTGIGAQIELAASTAALSVTTGAGSAVSGSVDAILARHDGTGAVAVSVAGAVNGGTGAAIRTQAVAASAQTITVGATGAVAASSGQAIAVEGVAVEIENLGLITGFVALTGGADLFTNDGTWVAAGLFSAFGGGNDRFENRGTLVAANASTQSQTTLLEDLETFVNRGGLILMHDGFSGDVLEIAGDFVADGGVLALDVAVDGNSSFADRMSVGGNVLRDGAATGILVNQTSAVGGPAEDGILVVQVAGASAADAFTLANPAPLELGAFVYELVFGGCANPADTSWYLCATDQPGSIATVYESGPEVLLSAFAMLPSLTDRQRQRQFLTEDDQPQVARGATVLPGAHSRFGGVWMRLHSERADVAPRSSVAGATLRRSNWGLQLGADLLAADSDGGDWVLGVTGQYGRVSADVRNAVGTGQISGQGWGIGFTATWHGLGGSYVDLQGQANRISTSYATTAQGLLADGIRARTVALSAEIGHRHALSPSTTLVPQAQLSWGRLDGGTFVDALGNAVDLGRSSTTTGRIGLAWEYNLDAAAGRAGGTTIYGVVNIRHDFSRSTVVSVGGTALQMRTHPTQAEIGLGGSVPLSPNAVLFGQASYRAPFGATSGNRTLSASAGLQVRW